MGSWVNKNTGGDFEKLVLAKDEVFEGIYLGSVDRSSKRFGAFTAHNFENPEAADKPFSMTGASLDNQLADVADGSKVRITFNGMKDTKSGNTVKDFTVQVYVDDVAAKGQAV